MYEVPGFVLHTFRF